MQEKELIEGCKAKDRKSMHQVFNLYAGKVKAMVYRYARTSFETDDILQETFIKVFSSIDTYNYQGSLESWIKKIAINTAINYYRKSMRQENTFQLESFGDLEEKAVDAISLLHFEELRNLINQLPEGYRFIFNMFAIEGYSHKEIAEMLNITESTSSSQYLRARKQIIKLLTIQESV